jgi:hypothetical protein
MELFPSPSSTYDMHQTRGGRNVGIDDGEAFGTKAVLTG